MKSKTKINVIVRIVIAVFLTMILFSIVDGLGNWGFKDLIYRTFTMEVYNSNTGGTDVIFTNWYLIKLIIIFIIFVIISTILLLPCYINYKANKKYKNKITELTKKINLVSTDTITLGAEEKDLENKINEGKIIIEKNNQLMKQTEERKNDLLVYLAHDLKTPLTSVIGYLSFLEETPELPLKQRQKYTDVALKKSYRLEELINELFDVARFNSEKIVLQKSLINLSVLFKQMNDEFYPMLKRKNNKIKIIENAQDIKIMADANYLSRVFNNILKNAISYSYEKSIIEVILDKEKNNVIITVKNKGDQIPKEKLNHIFEKFYRADYSRSTQTGNAGLGLAIAKEIVELHDGTIEAISEEEYTSFIIKLPIKKSA